MPSMELGPDSFSWVTGAVSSSFYSSSKTWDVLRPKGAIQRTAKRIWFPGATPKHAFHLWVTNLNRLPTRDRLLSWGMPVSPSCCICSNRPESRDHLMLSCSYVLILWAEVRVRLQCTVPTFNTWSELMEWTCLSTVGAPSVLKMLVTQALVYSVWRQRNNMLHNQSLSPPLVEFKDFNMQVINSINAQRNKKKFKDLMCRWLL